MAIAKNPRKSAPAAAARTKVVKKAKVRPAKAKADDAGDDDGDGAGRSTPLGLDIDAEVLDFIEALDRFKKSNNRPFPSWSEVLFVLKQLGYRKG